MTDSHDGVTAALHRALHRHAEDAPPTTGLAEQVRAVAKRRRARRTTLIVTAVLAAAVALPVTINVIIDDARTPPPAAHEGGPNWRWESYRGVEVQVPATWGHGVPGRFWCLAPEREQRPGAVGRPTGGSRLVDCPSEYPPVEQRENWLSFDSHSQTGTREVGGGWVEETRMVAGVYLTLLTNDEQLRADILGSARPVNEFDHHGCPANHPVADDPDGSYRPAPPRAGLPTADAVQSISVCRYARGDLATNNTNPPILSSTQLIGDGAAWLIDAIQSSPHGQGPNNPNAVTSGPNVDYGQEVMILRIHTADSIHEVLVRYGGDYGNSIDDGTTKRKLTADVLAPLLTGAHRPNAITGTVANLLPRTN